jgi:pimeloyl-ACP methyl ester carboxylesterase
MPADLAYGALLEALGGDVEVIAKDLEVYAAPEPPPAYTLDYEIDGVLRVADHAGFERFHLLGYSGGGASSLVFALLAPIARLRGYVAA